MFSFLGELHKDRLLPMLSWILCFSMSDQGHGVVVVTLHWGGDYSLQTNLNNFLLLRALSKAEIASNLQHFSFTDEIIYSLVDQKHFSLLTQQVLVSCYRKKIIYFLSLLFLDIFARFGRVTLKTCWKSIQFLLKWVSSFLAQFNEVKFIPVCLPSDIR